MGDLIQEYEGIGDWKTTFIMPTEPILCITVERWKKVDRAIRAANALILQWQKDGARHPTKEQIDLVVSVQALME
jgi:hypothetical protein